MWFLTTGAVPVAQGKEGAASGKSSATDLSASDYAIVPPSEQH